MKRKYHHYKDCEEWGMWAKVSSSSERAVFIAESAALMRDSAAFRDAMRRAVLEWPVSCQHNLTCDSINHLAWLGHAGCFLAVGSPEECTRLGWRTLSRTEQGRANGDASAVLAEWRHLQSIGASAPPLFDLAPYTVVRVPRGRPRA